MAAPTFTLDGLNLNDGTSYTLLPNVELGARVKTWDEQRSYAGGVAQTDVSEAYLVPATFSILVQGTSEENLATKVGAINTKLDGMTASAGKSFVYNGTTYVCGASPRVAYVIGQREQNTFATVITLSLNRLP